MKKKKSLKKILLTTLISIIAVIFILLVGIRVGEKLIYLSFYTNSTREFATPGMSTGFVGQGLDYVEEKQAFIAAGYSAKKGEASSVIVIDKDGKQTECLLKNADGSNYTGHTGGIAHAGKFAYITGADGCDVFMLDDLFTKSEAKVIGEVKTPTIDPAYCVVAGDKFYVGSFYRPGNYETGELQRITTPAGDKNTSIMLAFNVDLNAEFGIAPNAVAAYSTTDQVQGMTFTEKEIVLSTSYGLATSYLHYYDWNKVNNGSVGVYDEKGLNIPLYYLDSNNKVATVDLPPMSEELVYKDGKIFIMTESASNKYIFGKFMSGRYIYAYKGLDK